MIKKLTREKKTRQFTASFRLSVFEALQKIAYMRQTSPNNLLNTIAEQYVAANADVIAQYDKLTESEGEQ